MARRVWELLKLNDLYQGIPLLLFLHLNHLLTVFSSTKFFCFNIVVPKFAIVTAWSCKLSFSIL